MAAPHPWDKKSFGPEPCTCHSWPKSQSHRILWHNYPANIAPSSKEFPLSNDAFGFITDTYFRTNSEQQSEESTSSVHLTGTSPTTKPLPRSPCQASVSYHVGFSEFQCHDWKGYSSHQLSCRLARVPRMVKAFTIRSGWLSFCQGTVVESLRANSRWSAASEQTANLRWSRTTHLLALERWAKRQIALSM